MKYNIEHLVFAVFELDGEAPTAQLLYYRSATMPCCARPYLKINNEQLEQQLNSDGLRVIILETSDDCGGRVNFLKTGSC